GLVVRIYRLEVPQQKSTPPLELAQTVQAKYTGQSQNQQREPQQETGFKQQKFEPSPLDELGKLILTPEEQNVDPEYVASIEVAKNALDFPIETNATIQ